MQSPNESMRAVSARFVALNAVAIAQPLLSLLGDNPSYFVAHGASPFQVVLLTALVLFALPAVCCAAVAIARRVDTRIGEIAHLGVVAGFLFILGLQLFDAWLPWPLTVVGSVALAGGATVLYVRQPGVRSMVTVMALSPLLFGGLFVFASPTTDVVFPSDVQPIDQSAAVASELSEPARGSIAPDADGGTPIDRINERFPPIVMVILDEFPTSSALEADGEIDAARLPNLARLTSQSHFWRNMAATGISTDLAIPGMLSGAIGTGAQAPNATGYPNSIYTLLGDIYDASEFSNIVDLCPVSICNGQSPLDEEVLAGRPADGTSTTTEPTVAAAKETPLALDENRSSFNRLLDDTLIVLGHLITPEGLDLGFASIENGWADFGNGLISDPPQSPDTLASTIVATSVPSIAAPTVSSSPPAENTSDDVDGDDQLLFLDGLRLVDKRAGTFARWIESLETPDAPELHIHHLLLPHVPWRYRPDGTVYADSATPGYVEGWWEDPYVATLAEQRHLLQLGYVDSLLGDLFDQLEEEAIFEKSMLIVAADHGIAFTPGSKARDPNETTLASIAAVPLWIKLPDQQASSIHDEPRSLVDLLATVGTELDLEVPWTEGTSLLEPKSSPETRHVGTRLLALEVSDALLEETLTRATERLERIGENLYDLVPGFANIGAETGDSTVPSQVCFDPEEVSTGYFYGSLKGTSRSVDLAVATDGIIVATGRSFRDGDTNRVQLIAPTGGNLVELEPPYRPVVNC